MAEDKKAQTDNVRKPTDEELEVAWNGPALNSNRFYVNIGANVRIAFCEQMNADKAPQFRTAVVLSHQDAIALSDLLKTMLAEIRETIDKAILEAKEQEKQLDQDTGNV